MTAFRVFERTRGAEQRYRSTATSSHSMAMPGSPAPIMDYRVDSLRSVGAQPPVTAAAGLLQHSTILFTWPQSGAHFAF
jgi:hypothetical protein